MYSELHQQLSQVFRYGSGQVCALVAVWAHALFFNMHS